MNQTDPFEVAAEAEEQDAAQAEKVAAERALVGSLVSDALAYRSSDDYQDLLSFVVRMRRFSPFNAALLHRQKPGLSYATFASEWRTKWKRTLEEGARPLVTLLPFGPVGFVYNILDTVDLPDAPDFPPGVYAFPATGEVKESALKLVLERVQDVGATSARCGVIARGNAASAILHIVRKDVVERRIAWNAVALVCPCAQVEQAAAFRAERAKGVRRRPLDRLAAHGAWEDAVWLRHQRTRLRPNTTLPERRRTEG